MTISPTRPFSTTPDLEDSLNQEEEGLFYELITPLSQSDEKEVRGAWNARSLLTDFYSDIFSNGTTDRQTEVCNQAQLYCYTCIYGAVSRRSVQATPWQMAQR